MTAGRKRMVMLPLNDEKGPPKGEKEKRSERALK